jgi:glycosyltransferase involved in cell wall biosynthesis
MQVKKEESWSRIEKRTWCAVENYMGRTEWDKTLSSVLHQNRRYFHVEEAIRPSFLQASAVGWSGFQPGRIRLFSTGCSTFWKGPDMLLKTAHILMESGVDFEWLVAGEMPQQLKRAVEIHERMKFADNHVRFLGFIAPDQLVSLLTQSTLYVHTAYVENSPNSICEAQLLGVPIVSTNVGGISSLIQNDVEGLLVPANDPWQMAGTILGLIKDPERMNAFSRASRVRARTRHDKDNVISGLLACYSSLIGR